MFYDKLRIITNEEGEFYINARDLHKELGVGREFAKWIKDRISKYKLAENINYYIITKPNESLLGGRPLREYMITLKVAKQIVVENSNNKKSESVAKYLSSFDNSNICFIKRNRKEIEFGEMLDKITGFKWKKQYPIDGGKYRLDFYIPSVLIVEYDEKHHIYQKQSDEERIKYCRKWLSDNEYESEWYCLVIRVKEGQELEGLNKIIRHLVGFEIFDEQFNYNLEVCDTTSTRKNI